MSDQGKPEDPWARWRKPEADAGPDDQAADDAKPAARRTAPARPAAIEPGVTPMQEQGQGQEPATEAPAKPTGTLGVRKTATPEARPGKRPVRGGALPRRPKAEPVPARAAASKPAPTPVAARKPASNLAPVAARKPVSAPLAPAHAGGEAPAGVRLSKVMSERGLCSRREADVWISRGWVYVDGVQISELGSRIDPDADISISQDAKKDQAKQMTIILHKPVGYVSGQPEPGFTPAVTLISAETQMVQSGDPEFKPWMLRGLAPAGRLDIDSTGLLVLTQDGRVAKKLIGEDSEIEKEYLVRVSGEMISGGLELLNHGLELDGKPLKPARVKQLNEDQLHFILKEGKKRQIRRMCELVGLRVVGLKRVRVGRVRLGDLPMGQWRFLRADEAF